MFTPDQYELLDFGAGRKLERFGPYVLDRPSPAAEAFIKRDTSAWAAADARFEFTASRTNAVASASAVSKIMRSASSPARGRWRCREPLPESWTIEHRSTQAAGDEPCVARFELRPTEFGHLGVFVEQAANWDWIAQQGRRAIVGSGSIAPRNSTAGVNPAARSGDSIAELNPAARLLKVLNLFAYTGGSTLAAAHAGAEVVHVDASASAVAWARRNATHSGLADAPIRWITEDALKFVRREVKRGNQYDAVVLDPPSYGHGPSGEPWKIEQHLPELLTLCAELTSTRRALMLLTCHSPRFGPAELSAYLADCVFGHCSAGGTSNELSIVTADGRKLPSGVVARWPG